VHLGDAGDLGDLPLQAILAEAQREDLALRHAPASPLRQERASRSRVDQRPLRTKSRSGIP
jgi:hypothetical protein